MELLLPGLSTRERKLQLNALAEMNNTALGLNLDIMNLLSQIVLEVVFLRFHNRHMLFPTKSRKKSAGKLPNALAFTITFLA